jgi:hypothetical protein
MKRMEWGEESVASVCIVNEIGLRPHILSAATYYLRKQTTNKAIIEGGNCTDTKESSGSSRVAGGLEIRFKRAHLQAANCLHALQVQLVDAAANAAAASA